MADYGQEQEQQQQVEQLLAIHKPQLTASPIPERHWRSLLRKLASGKMDAGKTFALTYEDEAETRLKAVVIQEEGVKHEDADAVWLVDHAWTFVCSQKPSRQLARHAPLLQRMAALVGIDASGGGGGGNDDEGDDAHAPSTPDPAAALRGLWPYANMYKLSGVPGYPSDEAVWYIMDEFGSRVRHSDAPSLGMTPFYFQPEGCMYSVLWALQDMDYGDEAMRDYLPHEKDPYLRAGKIVAFHPDQPLPDDVRPAAPTKLAGDDAGPPPADLDGPWEAPVPGPIKVFTDLRVVHEALTDPRFRPVGLAGGGKGGEEAGAEVWWATRHIRSFETFARERPHQLVGQLPNQKQLVCKDLLIETCYGGDGSARGHLPLSYNLECSLHDFIREYRRRAAGGEDNVWIVKPWNQGRSMGVVVSDSLPHILRLMETGPKVVCKYITRPVTLRGFKFDLRVYLLIRQGGPEPRAYVHKRVVGRMANVPYAAADFDDFERHGTVFHYRTDLETKNRLTYPEFAAAFDAEHGAGAFERARARIHAMAADVVRAACRHGNMGHYQRARALLGLDVMLEAEEEGGDMRPRLLEATYQPDCRRILQEHPCFLNEVFACLVLDEVNDEEIVQVV